MKDYIEFASTFLTIMFGIHITEEKLINYGACIFGFIYIVIGLLIIIITGSEFTGFIYYILVPTIVWAIDDIKSDDDNDDME